MRSVLKAVYVGATLVAAAGAPFGEAVAAGFELGAVGPGYCDAAGRAPAPDAVPEGFVLKTVFANCADVAAVDAGRRARLDSYGYVFTPRPVSPWERAPQPENAAPERGDAFASFQPERDQPIRALNRPNPERSSASGTVRQAARFTVDQTAEATLRALSTSLQPGQRTEIGRWVERRDMRLTAEFVRPEPVAEQETPATRLRVTSEVRWRSRDGGAAGVTRVLVLPYRNADTLRYVRAHLRASAAADRIAWSQIAR